MAYTALYRKFRPQTFDDVKGQGAIVMTLKNQIEAGRIGHAFLFCGTRGTGKTSSALIFAKAVNCEHPVDGSPCGECESCRAIAEGRSMNIVEMDAASNNGVDAIRQLIEEVQYSPTSGKYKVYIIDEVHMLSAGAFNALLKTLEEPPSYAIFILATTDPQKIPITILSRCQRYDFKRASVEEIAGRLKQVTDAEGVEIEDKALRYVATTADGSFRDGLSMLDRCITFYLGQTLTYDKCLEVLGAVDVDIFGRLIWAIKNGDCATALQVLDQVIYAGRELTQFASDFAQYLRNLYVAKATGGISELISIPTDYEADFLNQVNALSEETLTRYIRIISNLINDIRYAPQKRILCEVALIKLCKPESESNLDSISQRVERVEERIDNGEITVSTQSGVANHSESIANELPEVAAPKVYDMALPEDIGKIISGWKRIIEDISPLNREFVQQGKVTITEDKSKLLLLFTNKMAYTQGSKPETQEQILKAIEKHIEKAAEIEMRFVDKREAVAFVDLEQMLKNKVKIEYTD